LTPKKKKGGIASDVGKPFDSRFRGPSCGREEGKKKTNVALYSIERRLYNPLVTPPATKEGERGKKAARTAHLQVLDEPSSNHALPCREGGKKREKGSLGKVLLGATPNRILLGLSA